MTSSASRLQQQPEWNHGQSLQPQTHPWRIERRRGRITRLPVLRSRDWHRYRRVNQSSCGLLWSVWTSSNGSSESVQGSLPPWRWTGEHSLRDWATGKQRGGPQPLPKSRYRPETMGRRDSTCASAVANHSAVRAGGHYHWCNMGRWVSITCHPPAQQAPIDSLADFPYHQASFTLILPLPGD